MGLIKFLTSGSWWVYSESDSRWNNGGSSNSVGMFGIPPEAQTWMDSCEKKYGDPPDDLTIGYMKD